jgi:hypothetical protein
MLTIMLSARDSDAGALTAVTGSIEPGYAPQIGISSGVLSAGIETMSAMLEDGSVGQQEAPLLRPRRHRRAEAQVKREVSALAS